MTTAFQTWSFLAGAYNLITPTNGRALADRLADFINVKEYGAVGDGIANDTIPIQKALAEAFGHPSGIPSLPHSIPPGAYSNKPVYFPAGNYRVTDTLYIESVFGPWIFGDGSGTTRIFYNGPTTTKFPTTQGQCNLFFTNGCNFARIEGIAFAMYPTVSGVSDIYNSLTDHTCCFNWNWNSRGNPGTGAGLGTVNTTHICFIDVGFRDAAIGCAIGDATFATDGNWGEQCDTTSFINCWADNCFYGVLTHQGNAMNSCWIGGSIKNCNQTPVDIASQHYTSCGLQQALPLTSIRGAVFENNYLDIANAQNNAQYISACRSTSPRFVNMTASGTVISGCTHKPSLAGVTPDYFCSIGAGTTGVSIDDCITEGYLTGTGKYFIRDTKFISAGGPVWHSALSQAQICEFASSSEVFQVADLPPVSAFAEGAIVSVHNANTATQDAVFDGVTTGTSKVLLSSSGGSARATLSFSSQPDVNSSVTISGRPILFQNAHLIAGNFGQIHSTSGTPQVGSGAPANSNITIELVGGAAGDTKARLSVWTGASGQLIADNPGAGKPWSQINPGSYTVSPTGIVDNNIFGFCDVVSVPPGLVGAKIDIFVIADPGHVFRGTTLAFCLGQLVNVIKSFLYNPVGGVYALLVGGTSVKLTALNYGTAGNGITLASSVTPDPHVSITPFAGGTAPGWKVTGA